MKNSSRFLVAYSVFAMAALVLAGCNSSPSGSETSGQESSLPSPIASSAGNTNLPHAPGAEVVKDQAKWTLPTDPYLVGEWSGSLQMQADSMLTASCMHEAGFPQYKEYWDASAPMPETYAGNGVSLNFNESNAAKYGYRRASDSRHLVESLIPADGGLYDNESQEFQDQWGLCTFRSMEEVKGVVFDEFEDTADAELPDDSGSIGSQLNQLQVDLKLPELQEAASLWRSCMAPQGIVDLPAYPWLDYWEMPESLTALWGGSDFSVPTADEINMAKFDAACRQSSGWFDVYYEAEWNTAEKFVNENKAALAPILAQYQADADMALAVIQKYSGQE